MQEEKNKYYPVKTDAVFKAIFNDKDLMKALLEDCLKEKIEIIALKPNEMTKKYIFEHGKRLDLVIKIKGKIINVEVNSTYTKETKERNFIFLCKMHSSYLEETEKYAMQDASIQINLNYQSDKEIVKKNFGSNNPFKAEYEMFNTKTGKKLGIDFKVIEIYVDKYYEAWYNKNDEITRENPMLVAISFRNPKKLNDYVSHSSNGDIRKMRDKVDAINKVLNKVD